MIKKFLVIIGLVLLVIVLLVIVLLGVLRFVKSMQENNMENQYSQIKEVCFEKKCFNVEVVEGLADKAKGLMERESLAENSGMLFLYNQERVISIWTKNMKIPIDVIWLNKDLEVVYLVENAQPCLTEKCESFKPETKAQYILEINAGQIQQNDVQLGHKAELN
ncbi:DUF192 domain-containing protein [Patescibacteria group bacterium]|nr:DUF192 domain-containing protein [Patescibacteria group bacterium]